MAGSRILSCAVWLRQRDDGTVDRDWKVSLGSAVEAHRAAVKCVYPLAGDTEGGFKHGARLGAMGERRRLPLQSAEPHFSAGRAAPTRGSSPGTQS